MDDRLLLHACCGPCASGALPRLQDEGYQPTVFFSNSNLYPENEYKRRRDTTAELCLGWNIPFIEDAYLPEAWLQAIKGHEDAPERGSRCTLCFRFNLERTARYAAENNYPRFTTTLTISPHKNAPLIFSLGKKIESPKSTFVEIDLKKKDGFGLSVRNSKALGLYRQNYCGCRFSLRN